MKTVRLIFLSGLVLLGLAVYFGNDLLRLIESSEPSTSHGSPANGYLENGKRLPTKGPNFRTYSRLGSLLGRNAVHHRVHQTILDAYTQLNQTHPDHRYIIGETGWVRGGPFPPHKTHQNGLSVDFMTPIKNKQGVVRELPTWFFNRFGYDIEFDEAGKHDDYDIDYEALAIHLRALDMAARENGIEIDRVIFDPVLQPHLFKNAVGQEIKKRLRFSARRSWVRHDEHYHVDFRVKGN